MNSGCPVINLSANACIGPYGDTVGRNALPECDTLTGATHFQYALPTAVPPALNPITQPPAQNIPGLPKLTPYDVVQPYPDITRALTPVPVSQCSLWCDLNGAIAANPLVALLVLGGFVMLLGRSR